MQRTTLALDPEILDLAKRMAQERKITLGEAVNYLIRRGLNAVSPVREKNGFAVFSVPPATASFGPDDVESALLDA